MKFFIRTCALAAIFLTTQSNPSGHSTGKIDNEGFTTVIGKGLTKTQSYKAEQQKKAAAREKSLQAPLKQQAQQVAQQQSADQDLMQKQIQEKAKYDAQMKQWLIYERQLGRLKLHTQAASSSTSQAQPVKPKYYLLHEHSQEFPSLL